MPVSSIVYPGSNVSLTIWPCDGPLTMSFVIFPRTGIFPSIRAGPHAFTFVPNGIMVRTAGGKGVGGSY